MSPIIPIVALGGLMVYVHKAKAVARAPIPSPQPTPPEGFSRFKGTVDALIVEQAKAALAHKWGSWLPFDHPVHGDMGILLEWHYHEPGGPIRPWGWHKGASVFVSEGNQ